MMQLFEKIEKDETDQPLIDDDDDVLMMTSSED